MSSSDSPRIQLEPERLSMIVDMGPAHMDEAHEVIVIICELWGFPVWVRVRAA